MFVASPRFSKNSRREGERLGEVELPQLERGRHDALAAARRAPASRARDLRDETVDVKSVQDAADFGAPSSVRVEASEMARAMEPRTDVAIGEAADAVCANPARSPFLRELARLRRAPEFDRSTGLCVRQGSQSTAGPG